MKIRQNLIDNIVSLDLTREQLAKQLLTARYMSLKHAAESAWLDQLAEKEYTMSIRIESPT
jgi:hypothetical protein